MNIPQLSEATGIPLDHLGGDDWLRPFGEVPYPRGLPPLVESTHLRGEVESSGLARNVTKTTLSQWRLSEFYEDAAVVVSELVTNALRYGKSCAAPEALRLVLVRYQRQLICMVTDPADEAPRMQEPDYIAESGRGLHIIDAISRSWGWTPLLGGGKAVWATFAIA